ncbi:hypothetical protein FF38_09418 [Lucilia cuprina]|uniref:Uncharacterized protein n=1 Tax=Lucilia cuprina TaxID=7375 RepID=A0A0L0C8X9_LUCCU|nr:hypothetical protein FF38_09418 [Lucilia cuprina]
MLLVVGAAAGAVAVVDGWESVIISEELNVYRAKVNVDACWLEFCFAYKMDGWLTVWMDGWMGYCIELTLNIVHGDNANKSNNNNNNKNSNINSHIILTDIGVDLAIPPEKFHLVYTIFALSAQIQHFINSYYLGNEEICRENYTSPCISPLTKHPLSVNSDLNHNHYVNLQQTDQPTHSPLGNWPAVVVLVPVFPIKCTEKDFVIQMVADTIFPFITLHGSSYLITSKKLVLKILDSQFYL